MAPSVLGPIAAEFNATALQGWISSGWLMSTCVAFVLAGRLSDIFGRKWIITGSNILAIAGFAMCAFTSNFSVSLTMVSNVWTDNCRSSSGVLWFLALPVVWPRRLLLLHARLCQTSIDPWPSLSSNWLLLPLAIYPDQRLLI